MKRELQGRYVTISTVGEKAQAFVDELMCEGFSVAQLISQLHERFVGEADSLKDSQKAALCEALAVSENRLLDGANEYLQVMDVATVLMKTLAQGA